MATKNQRLVLYIPPEFKERLQSMASLARPPTSTNRMATYLLRLGLDAHNAGWTPEPEEASNGENEVQGTE